MATIKRTTVIAGREDYTDRAVDSYLRNEAASLLKGISRADLTIEEKRILKTATSLLPAKRFAVPVRRNPAVASKVRRRGAAARKRGLEERTPTAVTESQVEEAFNEEPLLASIRCELYEALCK